MFIKSRKAFTLAEVLITLGIIGVVAAMTIPTLMTKIQNRMFVAQLKKEYSTLQQGFRMVLAQEGVDVLSHTSLGSEFGFIGYGGMGVTAKQKEFWNTYFKGITFQNGYFKLYHDDALGDINPELGAPKELGSGRSFAGYDMHLALNMMSGSEIGVNCADTIDSSGCSIGIDVNGMKAPNTLGRDIFFFVLLDDGILYPEGSGKKQNLSYFGNSNSWKEDSSLCGTAGSKIIASSVKGYGCAARIMDEGWQMNY